MTDPFRPISEDDIHAYVDNLLPPERRPVVQRYLQENPVEAARVAAFTAQREALRAALVAYANSRLPPRLNPYFLIEQARLRRRLLWRAAAAVVLAIGVSGSGGWFLHRALTPGQDEIAALVREAVANHVVYTADRRRPTELGADQRDDLARWVSNRINRKVEPPDLSESGFRYIGGRLAATSEGPAGMFMYQNEAGMRLTVFVRPDQHIQSAPISPVPAKPIGGAAWVDKGIGYTVVAPVSPDELRRLAEQVQRLVNSRA